MRISNWSSEVCSSDLLDHFAQLIAEGRSTDESDFRFHTAIAAATNNSRFKTFLEHIGRRMIPRVKFRTVMGGVDPLPSRDHRSAEHTSELQSLMRISDAVLCLNKKKHLVM